MAIDVSTDVITSLNESDSTTALDGSGSTTTETLVSTTDGSVSASFVPGPSEPLGLYIGIGVGAFLALLFCIAIAALLLRHRRRTRHSHDSSAPIQSIDSAGDHELLTARADSQRSLRATQSVGALAANANYTRIALPHAGYDVVTTEPIGNGSSAPSYITLPSGAPSESAGSSHSHSGAQSQGQGYATLPSAPNPLGFVGPTEYAELQLGSKDGKTLK
jgi:hypothetical protein